MKRLFNILLICLLIIIPIAKADSGWDSSYSSSDYGSSWSSSDYGSSWDSDYSYSGGGSFDADDFDGFVMFVIVLFVIIFIAIVTSSTSKVVTDISKNFYVSSDMTQDEINQIDSSININDISQYTYKLFVDVQQAWTNFNYDKLRDLLSDELFNDYKMQLETLELQFGKNIMDDFEFVEGSVVSVNKTKLTEQVIVKLHVRMKDYVINTKTNEITHGDKNKVMDITYLITLEKSIRDEITNCPNCGGELKDTASQKCPFCDAVLVKGSKDFVMVKKENIRQQYR